MRDTYINLPFFHSFILSFFFCFVLSFFQNVMACYLYMSAWDMTLLSRLLSAPTLFYHALIHHHCSPIFFCFQRSEMASGAADFIFYPLNIVLLTLRRTNYSQINNVPNLFGIISGSFRLPLCSDRRGKAVSTPGPPSNYVVITCHSHFLSI